MNPLCVKPTLFGLGIAALITEGVLYGYLDLSLSGRTQGSPNPRRMM